MGDGAFRAGLATWLIAIGVAQNIPAAETQALPGPQHRPHWAASATPSLWSFAWVSDMHLDQSRQELLAKALHHLDGELRPRFVLITGDNNALAAPPANPGRPEPLGLRRQLFLKAFLQEHLKSPYAIIPGDNWPEDFDRVFGAKQYSFDYGGLHFLLLAPDRTYHGKGNEGLSVFDAPTWEWIGRDLQRNRQQPTIVAIHEPVCPRTFLDAGRLRKLLDGYPNVIAVLQGHLHVDLEFRSGGRSYLVAPSLGKTSPPGMKWISVHPEMLIVRTIQYEESTGRFRMTNRWQKIGVPESLRSGLRAPAGPRFTMANYEAVPPHPHREDPALAERKGELLKLIGESLGKDLWLWK